jgi:DNA-directed RNA polymerase subunit beta'
MSEAMTFGQHMLASILPEDVYKPGDTLNKKGIKAVMTKLARQYPEDYEDISHRMVRFGLKSGESMGGASFGIKDLMTPPEIKKYQHDINMKIKSVLDTMPRGKERRQAIQQIIEDAAIEVPDKVVAAGKAIGNKFNLMLEGAGRGNAKSVAGMLAGDMMATDSQGRTIPIPITRGYSQGQRLSQYLAGAYTNRKDTVTTKMGVAQGGYLGKLLAQAAHRAVVVADDDDQPVGTHRGIFAQADDTDNIGALLAKDYGPYKRNTVITPKVMESLKQLTDNGRIFIRSPIAASSLDSGLYAKDVGVREYGRLPIRGEHIGLPSSQAISEQVTQALLGAKHGQSRVKRKTTPGLSGFNLVERLISPPKEGQGLAVHSPHDGIVTSIREAPQGGWYVKVGRDNDEIYAGGDFTPTVKVGDEIEAGDPITEGNIDPAEVTRHRGIGEGRIAFVNSLHRGLKEAGFPVNRRNIEILASGAIDRVDIEDSFDGFEPGDVVPYSRLERLYKPREGAQDTTPQGAIGRYLEKPVGHLTIGTRVTPRMVKDLHEIGVDRVTSHHAEPLFKPRVTRSVDILQTDDDFMTRFMGSNLQKSLLDSVHQSASSDEQGTSFVPARASAVNLPKTLFAN